MFMYLFIYTLIGFGFLYLVAPAESTLLKRHFYLKATLFILTWPIAAIIYLFILRNHYD